MARRRHTPEQIIRKLREADQLLGEGAEIAAVARHLECPRPPINSGASAIATSRRVTSRDVVYDDHHINRRLMF